MGLGEGIPAAAPTRPPGGGGNKRGEEEKKNFASIKNISNFAPIF